MTDCAHCGRPTDKRLCHECSLEARFGLPDDDTGVDAEDDEWEVDQQGLGDRDAAGQARLDGGIEREDSDD